MTDIATNNKRIAKNTVFLYFRMLLIMAVTLYTSRVILQVLGVEDFGIYNVVGGVALSFVFFSASLSNATQRFLNFELGVGNIDNVKNIFNLSLLTYVVIAIIVVIVAECVGGWLMSEKLVIPPERYEAAYFVFHVTIISLAITLIGVVFDSVLIARENMKVYAYIGVFEAMAKLGIVFVLDFADYDKLKLYAVLHLAVVLLAKAFPMLICLRKYPECRVQLYWNKQLFVSMFKFVGWNGFGTAVWAINEYGMVILLNIFFGPIVNAARAIATQVSAAVNNFSNNFMVAVRPQIVKSYAAQDYSYFIKLVFNSSKYSYFLMWILCLPIILRCDYILQLWLGEVPENATLFVQWILIYNLVNILTSPIWSAMQAVGQIKKYILIGSTIFLMAFPISYVFLRFGFPPIITFQVITFVRLVYLIVAIKILHSYIQFSILQYAKLVILPIIIVSLLSGGIMYYINSLFNISFLNFIAICAISLITSVMLILWIGITQNDRKLIKSKLFHI